MTRTPFQITAAMVARSSTFTESEIGLWCVIVNGVYKLYPTREEALSASLSLND